MMESENGLSMLMSRPLVTQYLGALPCTLLTWPGAAERERILIGDFHFHCELPLKEKHLQIQSGLHPSLLDPLHILDPVGPRHEMKNRKK